MFEDMDTEFAGGPPPEESDNRTFLIAAGILGGITLLALVCIAVYAIFVVPANQERRLTQEAEINRQNTQVAQQQLTSEALTRQPTSTPLPTATLSPTPSLTSVVAAATATQVLQGGAPTEDPRTATVAALLTQAAGPTSTVIATATALPDTGFADDVGAPGLLALAVVFLVVIFLVRRMRAVTG